MERSVEKEVILTVKRFLFFSYVITFTLGVRFR